MNSSTENFNRIIGGNIPVLVDFYADWCMPCRMLSPILKELAADMGNSIRILKVDVDSNPQVAMKYGVYSVPTILLFQEGEVIWKGSGARPKEELKRILHGAAKMKHTA
jgi:thioredoxin 1